MLVAFAILLILLLSGWRRLRGTTLTAACAWATISTLCLAGIAFLGPGPTAIRFSLLATTFCPLMAVLGAKRPQDKGWQWVVASLWAVLVWPAGQAVLVRSESLHLFVAWKLFLAGLILLGPLNYLPTRFWSASLLVALGQIVLLGEYLWQVPTESAAWLPSAAAACFAVAALIVGWSCRSRRRSEKNQGPLAAHTRRWRDFRDAYGAFWALRILGRVNQTAELCDWPLHLTWAGFEQSSEKEPTMEQLAEVDQTMSTLLRRFT